MSNNLEFFELNSLSEKKPKKLMVFLHGYGASGENLINLGQEFKKATTECHFISPNAPFKSEDPFSSGFQWFSLMNRDPKILYPQIIESNNILDSFINAQLARFNLTRKDLFLTGFSQGAMMAMYNSMRNEENISGTIAYSGRLILPTMTGEEIKSKPNICLIHGKKDAVVPFECFTEAEDILKTMKSPFESHAIENLEHEINMEGIKIAKQFLLGK